MESSSGGATEEDVAIGKALSEFLLEDKAFCKERKIISRKVYLCGYDGQIFCKSVDTLTQALGRHVKNAGIDPDAKICHGLRASFITSVYENFGIGEAQDLARHKSPNTTRQYIPEGCKTKKRQAIIDSLFGTTLGTTSLTSLATATDLLLLLTTGSLVRVRLGELVFARVAGAWGI